RRSRLGRRGRSRTGTTRHGSGPGPGRWVRRGWGCRRRRSCFYRCRGSRGSRRLGSSRARRTTWVTGGAGGTGRGGRAAVHGFAQLAHDGGFDCRRSGFDELSEILELGQDSLAVRAELLGQLVNAGLTCHGAPYLGPADYPRDLVLQHAIAHRELLIEDSSSSRPASGSNCLLICFLRLRSCQAVLPQHRGVERSRGAERPSERRSTLRRSEALRPGVEMRTPARQPPTWIGDENTVDDHDTQQLGGCRPSPAPDTGTDRLHATRPKSCSHLSYRGTPRAGSERSGSASVSA
ncbi:MAG: hypothetical protein QOC80_1885, partial [Frankiaceae bacterium]|nr:hypothetical protein [Frankiaceae bacterium]